MKQIKFSIQLLIVALPLILGFTNLKAQGELDVKDKDKHVKGDCFLSSPVIWSGPVVSGNVVDQDLEISNSVLPQGSTHITACNQNVCVNFDGIISGDPAGGSVLQIEAALGRTVTINVLADSGFVGSSNLDPLCLVFQGEGEIIFQLYNSNGPIELFFGSSMLGVGSVKAFVVTPSDLSKDGPTVTFQRTGPQSCINGIDIKVTINHGSLFTFAAFNKDYQNQTATVQFQLNNRAPSRMILNIEDQGAFVIAGCLVREGEGEYLCNNSLFNDLSLSDFDLNTPTLQNFVVTVIAQDGDCSFESSCADLLILNKNKTLGNLLCDPWCNLGTRDDENFVGSFNGNERYGFVIGANGELDIQNNISVNYVDLGRMVCPSDVFTFNDNVPNSSQVKKRNPAALTIDGYNGSGSLNALITIGQNSGLFFRSGVDLNGMVQNDENSLNPFTIDFSQRTPGAGNVVLSVEAPLDIFGQDYRLSDSACPNGLDYQPLSKIEILSLEVSNSGGLFDCCLPGCFPKKTFKQNDCCNYYRYNAASFLINNVMTLNNVTLVHSDENHKVYEKNDVLSEPTYIGGDALACRNCFNNNINRRRPCEPSSSCLPCPVTVFEQMVFKNSALWVKTDIAFTGFDLEVPNYSDCYASNVSRFIFFQNGIQCDKGFGRNMILGTAQGSFACDGCTVINGDTQLDVIQNRRCGVGLTTNETVPASRKLNLQVAQNKSCDTLKAYSCYDDPCEVAQKCPVDTQTSIHSIYLGNKSNITVGGNAFLPGLPLEALSQLNIAGNFFAFETNGGVNCTPQDSLVTGTGGIFVDENGDFSICPQYRAFFGTVVAKSGNGSINLPPRQVVWAPGIGITDWKIDLSDSDLQQLVTPQPSDCTSNYIVETPIVGEDQYYSEYKFNWFTTVKDYNLFCPFKIGLYNPCTCPPVTCSNINALPAVLGTVDQFQITGSRLGDPAHISVRGGLIREFLYIPSGHSGEEPTSVIVLSDQGTVGLGSAHRNPQSLLGSIVLGINGVTIIAEGDGQVNLNEDVIIDNICAIVRGPGFVENTLTISSDCCRTIRVKSGACLDLSQFNGGDTIKLAGNVQLVLEPGSCILFNQTQTMDGFATLALTDNASIVLEPVVKTDSLLPDCLDITPLCQEYICCFGKVNPARVKLLGHGQIKLGGNSYFSVPKDSYLGIETLEPVDRKICPKVVRYYSCPAPAYSLDNCEVVATDITITLNDSAKFNIGNNTSEKGGVVQIGNVEDHIFNLGCPDQGTATVAFTLNVDGANAQFSIGTQGFLGFGVGVIDKSSEIPNEWLVKTLYNLDRVILNITNGTFAHERIYSGEEPQASLLAFADNDDANYSFAYQQIVVDPLNLYEPLSMIDISKTSILGGGNMVLIEQLGSAVHPVVTCYNGLMSPLPLTAALLASTPMLGFIPATTNIATLFKALSTPVLELVYNEVSGSAIPESFGLINAASSNLHNNVRLGYIDNCLINRNNAFAISGDADYTTKITHAIKAGAIPVIITTKDGEVPPDNCSFVLNPCSFDCSNSPTIRPIIEMFAHKGNVL